MKKNLRNLSVDLIVIILSVIFAIVIIKTDLLSGLLHSTQGVRLLGSFIAGIFYNSIFTTTPATVTLGEIALHNSLLSVALLGAIGASIGDFVIFKFIKDKLSEDICDILNRSQLEKFSSIFHKKLFRWIIPLLGALIIASPLPDEAGVMMMGLSKMRTTYFVLLVFSLNFFGITLIGLIARSLV